VTTIRVPTLLVVVNDLVAFCSVVAQLTHLQNGTMFTATQKPGEVFLLTVSLAFLQTGSPLRMMTPTGPFLLPPPLDFLALLVWNKIQTLKRFGLLDLLELRVVLKTHGTAFMEHSSPRLVVLLLVMILLQRTTPISLKKQAVSSQVLCTLSLVHTVTQDLPNKLLAVATEFGNPLLKSGVVVNPLNAQLNLLLGLAISLGQKVVPLL
jgi:hypothetical protein